MVGVTPHSFVSHMLEIHHLSTPSASILIYFVPSFQWTMWAETLWLFNSSLNIFRMLNWSLTFILFNKCILHLTAPNKKITLLRFHILSALFPSKDRENEASTINWWNRESTEEKIILMISSLHCNYIQYTWQWNKQIVQMKPLISFLSTQF